MSSRADGIRRFVVQLCPQAHVYMPGASWMVTDQSEFPRGLIWCPGGGWKAPMTYMAPSTLIAPASTMKVTLGSGAEGGGGAKGGTGGGEGGDGGGAAGAGSDGGVSHE